LIQALQALRGVSTISATVIAAEIGDLRRFPTASKFMAFLGLVPSEHSSGLNRRQGRITRTGNGHVRRILVEAAWHYRHRPNLSPALRKRSGGVAEGVRRIAWKAQKRLHKRMYQLTNRGKTYPTTVTAMARELAGFVWAIGQEEQLLTTA